MSIKTEMEWAEITNVHNNFEYQSHLEQPKELYHYTSLNTLQTILANKQLRFTNRAYLNDKSEGTYVLSLCKEKIVSFGHGKKALVVGIQRNFSANTWMM